ncbi:MAG: squalene synthase HpnC [Planctomycetota bacterium]
MTASPTTTTFARELLALGPDADAAPMSRDEAWAYVHQCTTSHDENFSVLSRLVPERMRDDFAAVYAFCRWSDDLGDETGADDAARSRSLELLAWWRGELERCVAVAAGNDTEPPRHPVFVTLSETIRRCTLPDKPFHDLISAFEQDQRITRYQSWDQVLDYCTGSADPVGRLVLGIGGYREEEHPELFRMSDATCTALQLTNFWQDVRRDLIERDRIYMPRDETGVTAEMLRDWMERPKDPEARVPFIKALRPLVERTWELFRIGDPLPRALSNELTPVIWLFGAGGQSVLRAVERIGCTTLWRRPTLPRWKKASLVALAGARFARLRSRRAA